MAEVRKGISASQRADPQNPCKADRGSRAASTAPTCVFATGDVSLCGRASGRRAISEAGPPTGTWAARQGNFRASGQQRSSARMASVALMPDPWRRRSSSPGPGQARAGSRNRLTWWLR